jgi:2'-5' RNA ligase
MRTFIAIEFSDAVRSKLCELGARLRRSRVNASWVRPEHLHLTLRFLGEIDEVKAEQVSELLLPKYAAHQTFELSVRGVGAFPTNRKPAVVWAGVTPLEGALQETFRIADAAALKVGIAAEARRFHPHATLARVREPLRVDALVNAIEKEHLFDAGGFTVRTVSLFKSELTPRGPMYTRLREFPLQCSSIT